MWLPRRANVNLASDEGWSLIEISVVVGLMGIVAATLVSFLGSSQASLERQTARTVSNDQVRLAVQSLDREVRSGNVVYNPTSEVFAPEDIAPSMSLRVYTQTNNDPRCVQWRITSAGNLEKRSWPAYFDPANPTHASKVSGWRVVASNITNRLENIQAFSRPDSNIVAIRLRASSNASKGSTVEVRQSVSGRNTLRFPTGTASEVCGPPVPDPNLPGAGRVPAY